MTSRRKFLTNISQLGVYSSIGINLLNENPSTSDPVVSHDISWKKIRKCFSISKSEIVNLNNGSAGVMPNSVLKKYLEATEEINKYAPYEVNNSWQETSHNLLNNLAREFGISNGQLNLVRNTTEAINMILWGLPFTKNDEVIYADWDYPFVNYTLQHLQKQKEVKLKTIKKSLIDLNDDEILKSYEEKITLKTKLIIITWITHREGRILPVKRIRNLAKKNNIEVLIDGAHVPGHIEHSLSDIDPEYYASSLHKWFNAPLGTGLLYINSSVIEKISPPISYHPKLQSQYVKFDYLGTRAFQNLKGIEEALVFLNKTGVQRKEEQLRSLSQYWISQVLDIPNLKILSPAHKFCAVNSFFIKGIGSTKIKDRLEKEFKVHVKTSSYERQKISFVRVSPNIYCNHKDLNRLIDGIHHIASS
jgi:selenocysteine lyase/cysteine desulfurase